MKKEWELDEGELEAIVAATKFGAMFGTFSGPRITRGKCSPRLESDSVTPSAGNKHQSSETRCLRKPEQLESRLESIESPGIAPETLQML
jgi:hypothetical protein